MRASWIGDKCKQAHPRGTPAMTIPIWARSGIEWVVSTSVPEFRGTGGRWVQLTPNVFSWRCITSTNPTVSVSMHPQLHHRQRDAHINAKPAVNTTDELIPSKSLPTHITANEGASIRTSCERRREKSPPSIMERRERRYSERVAIGGVAEAKTEVR